MSSESEEFVGMGALLEMEVGEVKTGKPMKKRKADGDSVDSIEEKLTRKDAPKRAKKTNHKTTCSFRDCTEEVETKGEMCDVHLRVLRIERAEKWRESVRERKFDSDGSAHVSYRSWCTRMSVSEEFRMDTSSFLAYWKGVCQRTKKFSSKCDSCGVEVEDHKGFKISIRFFCKDCCSKCANAFCKIMIPGNTQGRFCDSVCGGGDVCSVGECKLRVLDDSTETGRCKKHRQRDTKEDWKGFVYCDAENCKKFVAFKRGAIIPEVVHCANHKND